MALNFNGSTSAISVNASPISSAVATIGLWINLDTGGTQALVRIGGNGAANPEFLFSLNASSQLVFSYADNSGGNSFSVTGATGLSTGSWTHVLATVTNGAQALYINGSSDGSDTQAIAGTYTPTGIQVGHTDYGGGVANVLVGDLAELVIYNSVIGTAEISSLANGAVGLLTPTFPTYNREYIAADDTPSIGGGTSTFTDVVASGHPPLHYPGSGHPGVRFPQGFGFLPLLGVGK